MKYEIVRRRKKVYARNPTKLVSWLRKNDPQLWMNNKEYMIHYAFKHNNFEGKNIDCSSESNFVSSLIKIGYIKIVEDYSSWNPFINKSGLLNSQVINGKASEKWKTIRKII